jgi:hypothetical protein
LFRKVISDYAGDFPHLIERSRFNRRRKQLFPILEKIRQRPARQFLEFEDYFIVGSTPLAVCGSHVKNGQKFAKHLLIQPLPKGSVPRKTYTSMAICIKEFVMPTGFSFHRTNQGQYP